MRHLNLTLENTLPSAFFLGKHDQQLTGFFPALAGHLNLSTCPLEPLS